MARSATYSVVPRMKPGDKNIREMAERIQSTFTTTSCIH